MALSEQLWWDTNRGIGPDFYILPLVVVELLAKQPRQSPTAFVDYFTAHRSWVNIITDTPTHKTWATYLPESTMRLS